MSANVLVADQVSVSPALALAIDQAKATIRAAVRDHGEGLTLLCSGQDAVLVDLALEVDPTIEVAFIDTGFHFTETIDTMMSIVGRYRPKLRIVAPWRHLSGVGKPDFCCSSHKVEQLDVALENKTAWMSGLRRADSPDRVEADLVETDHRGLAKFNPLVFWSDEVVAEYEQINDIIINPLRDRGYPSIGCRPCTSPVDANDADARSGRWAGSGQTECGIHL